jgi:hypothetical protein
VPHRSAPWPTGCKIAARRDYAVLQSCWLWHSRIVRSSDVSELVQNEGKRIII